jgi:hypothetical protein
MSKIDRVRSSFKRAHDDLFDAPFDAEFVNTTQGSYDPNTGEISSTETSLGTIAVEIVPPAMDTTVDVDGTSFSWDSSIRFPEDKQPGDLIPLGEDSREPTQVIITDPEEDNTDAFELHGYSYEKGSGMIMCRLVEQ